MSRTQENGCFSREMHGWEFGLFYACKEAFQIEVFLFVGPGA